MAEQRYTIFSYGSNSNKQLQRRVENLSLRSSPAALHNYSRCFCLAAKNWGGGGVASLCPDLGATTYGSVVCLSLEEKERLDRFELPAYRLEPLRVFVQQAELDAYAYIAGTQPTCDEDPYTLPMSAPPSEPYLVAIYSMLAEHYKMINESITVRSYNPKAEGPQVVVVQEWNHPGIPHLKDLGSMVVEINSRREEPWVMPQTIDQIITKLCAADISSVLLLTQAVADGTINDRLRAAGQLEFGTETCSILRSLLVTV